MVRTPAESMEGRAARVTERAVPFMDCLIAVEAPSQIYPLIKVRGKTVRLARAIYMVYVGPIPEGMEIDHTCYTPRCIQPSHLEAVSRAENLARRRNHGYRKPRCKKGGHPKAFTPNGAWECPTCRGYGAS